MFISPLCLIDRYINHWMYKKIRASAPDKGVGYIDPLVDFAVTWRLLAWPACQNAVTMAIWNNAEEQLTHQNFLQRKKINEEKKSGFLLKLRRYLKERAPLNNRELNWMATDNSHLTKCEWAPPFYRFQYLYYVWFNINLYPGFKILAEDYSADSAKSFNCVRSHRIDNLTVGLDCFRDYRKTMQLRRQRGCLTRSLRSTYRLWSGVEVL